MFDSSIHSSSPCELLWKSEREATVGGTRTTSSSSSFARVAGGVVWGGEGGGGGWMGRGRDGRGRRLLFLPLLGYRRASRKGMWPPERRGFTSLPDEFTGAAVHSRNFFRQKALKPFYMVPNLSPAAKQAALCVFYGHNGILLNHSLFSACAIKTSNMPQVQPAPCPDLISESNGSFPNMVPCRALFLRRRRLPTR